MATQSRRRSCMHPNEGAQVEHADHHHRDASAEVPKVRDPVCGMTVTPGVAKGGSASYGGRDYWFCNPKCREKFVADPAKFVGEVVAHSPPPKQDGAVYTCPMHPEVRQDH